jgi:hypothetical protein
MRCVAAVFEAIEIRSRSGSDEFHRVENEADAEWESGLFWMEEYEEAIDLSEQE